MQADPVLWNSFDNYICDLYIPPDPELEQVLKSSSEAGLPPHNVAPNQGKMLQFFAQMQNSRNILEIGTLGGYSTIWLARGLQQAEGKVITLEVNPKHAEIARKNFEFAGLSKLIDCRVGDALDLLPALAKEIQNPFDFIFIDADKKSNTEYFEWALKMSRNGTLIIVDNVVRNGSVLDASSTDVSVQGVRRFNQIASADRRVSGTQIQTVGCKGYDGFAMIIVKDR